jgi:hypothetical protein
VLGIIIFLNYYAYCNAPKSIGLLFAKHLTTVASITSASGQYGCPLPVMPTSTCIEKRYNCYLLSIMFYISPSWIWFISHFSSLDDTSLQC